jgi:hypothetical protein
MQGSSFCQYIGTVVIPVAPAFPVFPAFLSFRAVQSVWLFSHSSCPVFRAILLSSGKIAGVPTPANIPAVVSVPANVAAA